MENFSWQCPYCNHHAIVTDSNLKENSFVFHKGNKDGNLLFETKIVICPNEQCKEYMVKSKLRSVSRNYNERDYTLGEYLNSWQLKPQSEAKPLPDYIPQAIKNDYQEACLIKDLSPKSSATLSRRCLQGMIRDFFKIEKKNLFEEINAIKDKVDLSTYDAIDAIRKIGNIGAHMEKDINLIIDIEPHEASTMIELIEMLIEDWYINRYEREQRTSKIIAIRQQKDEAKNTKTEILQENCLS